MIVGVNTATPRDGSGDHANLGLQGNEGRAGTMGKTVGFGVVGTGVIFRDHAAALRHLGGAARLVGVAELDEGRRTDATSMAYAPVACKDYHDLLKRDDIDVISVCTPPAYHGQVVIDALDAGKYVVCEKPLAQTLEAADRIIEHAKKYPGKLSTVFQLRYEPEMRRIKWLLDSGHLGKLVYAHCSRRANLVGTGGEKGGWWGNWTTASCRRCAGACSSGRRYGAVAKASPPCDWRSKEKPSVGGGVKSSPNSPLRRTAMHLAP